MNVNMLQHQQYWAAEALTRFTAVCAALNVQNNPIFQPGARGLRFLQ